MSLPWGFNCHNAGYVTDGAQQTALEGDFLFPTTVGIFGPFGWDANAGVLDRDTSVDAAGGHRLAGICYASPGTTRILSVTIPAGTYDISLALGDFSNAWPNIKAVIKDGTSTLWTASGSSGAANSYVDATNTVLTAANWIAAGAGNPKTGLVFPTGAFKLELSSTSGSDYGILAHLNIAVSGGGGGSDAGLSAFVRMARAALHRLRR